MRIFISIIALLIVSSCKTHEEILMQKNVMSTAGEITYVDGYRGFLTIRWECFDPPFANQPCFKYMEFPVFLFENPVVGQKIIVGEK